jgi:hypothetical protein
MRTVHGLQLDDLDCIRRYRAEHRGLAPDERVLIHLGPTIDKEPLRMQNGRSGAYSTS